MALREGQLGPGHPLLSSLLMSVMYWDMDAGRGWERQSVLQVLHVHCWWDSATPACGLGSQYQKLAGASTTSHSYHPMESKTGTCPFSVPSRPQSSVQEPWILPQVPREKETQQRCKRQLHQVLSQPQPRPSLHTIPLQHDFTGVPPTCLPRVPAYEEPLIWISSPLSPSCNP